MIKGISKDEPIETNKLGGKQSASPYAMHLIDPRFMKVFYCDDIITSISDFMSTSIKDFLIQAVIKIEHLYFNDNKNDVLLKVSQVRKEACAKYPPQNWRLIPQEEHINHALVHYLAYKAGDMQDDHLEHCLCRLMFAYSTEVSEGFSYV